MQPVVVNRSTGDSADSASGAGGDCCRRRRPKAELSELAGTVKVEPAGMALPGTTLRLTASSSRRLTLFWLAIDSKVTWGLAVIAAVGGGPAEMLTFWPG